MSPSEGRGGAFHVKALGTPGLTTLVVSSNLDEPPIKIAFAGSDHKQRAQDVASQISRLRELDYDRRHGSEVVHPAAP